MINIISSVNAFKRQLLFSTTLQRQDLRYSQHMNSELVHLGKTTLQFNSKHYLQPMYSMSSDFDKRFTDFVSVGPVATYMCFPFATDIYVEDIVFEMETLFQLDTTAVENEIFSLQNDLQMKFKVSIEREGSENFFGREVYQYMKMCFLYSMLLWINQPV